MLQYVTILSYSLSLKILKEKKFLSIFLGHFQVYFGEYLICLGREVLVRVVAKEHNSSMAGKRRSCQLDIPLKNSWFLPQNLSKLNHHEPHETGRTTGSWLSAMELGCMFCKQHRRKIRLLRYIGGLHLWGEHTAHSTASNRLFNLKTIVNNCIDSISSICLCGNSIFCLL